MIYFFAKVDTGNQLLEFAEQLGGFYIGFYREEEKISNQIYDFRNDTDVPIRLNYPDWEYINLFSEERWRNKIIIVTYDSYVLSFWEITDKVKRFNEVHSEDDLPQKLKDLKKNDLKYYNLWNFLPVKLKKTINRSILPSSIDSLSVYQYLNRGTFRPVFRLAEYKDKFSFYSKKTDDLFELKVKNHLDQETIIKETKYSRILRFIFDAILTNGNKYTTELKYFFANLSEVEKNQIFGMLLNPAQVETLAMLLIQDVGFTADIGIGKGLDFVDIKGSLRHRDQINVELLLSKLTKFNLIEFSKSTFKKIIDEKTINIQCKAESYSNLSKDIIYIITDTSSPNIENIIFINNLIKKVNEDYFQIEFPLLSDWVKLQKHSLGLN